MDIIQEVSQNFIDSAYDTNTNRAFPDARDGLKPGMRACLWTMYKQGYTSNKPHVKSAKIDGYVAANFWPHGTVAIYETFARMSQPFTNNVPEVDFHGANGNVILGGSAIAADRYSEARLASVAERYMLDGVDKNSVDMIWNFSEDEQWPSVLPAVFPRLLVNGSQGIGVSIANSWACHNLKETCDMLISYLKTDEVDNENYFPDWPCGATIVNKNDLPQINLTGKGHVITEAKYEICGKEIRFTEFPFQVYIEPLIEEIKEAIESDKIHNVVNVFNKSDKKQVLLTVTCSSADKVKATLAELFAVTSLRSQFNVNQVAIVGKTPKLLTLSELCDIYVSHNVCCIKRSSEFDLEKALDRIEVLEGLVKALGDIDNVIKVIKGSESATKAKENLTLCGFSERQVDAILAMKLSRLTHLEADEIAKELQKKRDIAARLKKIVGSEEEQKKILVSKLRSLSKQFGTPRRSVVMQKEVVKPQRLRKDEEPQQVVITYTTNGYIKSTPISKYREVNENLGGIKMMTDDYVQIYNSTKVYRLKVGNVKQCLASEKGTAIGVILGTGLTKINHICACGSGQDLVAVSKSGRIKRFDSSLFDGTTQNIKGQDFFPKNEVEMVSPYARYAVLRADGRTLSADISQLKSSGKASTGRIAIKLNDGEWVDDVSITDEEPDGLASLGTRGA